MSCTNVVETYHSQKIRVENFQSSSIGCGTLTVPLNSDLFLEGDENQQNGFPF